MTTNKTIPLVSIFCPTYNHEKYISQALDGFMMQKTSFPFEIIVHDDASSDRTCEIVKEYERKSPELFANIFQTENQYSKGRGNFIIKILLAVTKGKYIALCEGDDYWTDPLKLQKQIDFLEANHDYVLCSANAKVINYTTKPFRELYCDFKQDKSFNQIEVLTEFYCPTLSMVFRNELKDAPEWFYDVKSGDTFMQLLLSRKGKFSYMNFICGVYRQHNNGISNTINKELWFNNNIEHLRKLESYVESETKPYLNEIILRNQLEYISALAENRQFNKALNYFRSLVKIPFSIRKKYFKRIGSLFVRTLLRK